MTHPYEARKMPRRYQIAVFCGFNLFKTVALPETKRPSLTKVFAEAARSGDLNSLRTHLQADKINAVDMDGRTALMIAAQFGQEGAVAFLVNAGADVDATDKYGWTALMLAAQAGNLNAVNFLHKKGADVDVHAKEGKKITYTVKTPGGTEERVGYPMHKQTALMIAAKFGHNRILESLLRAGANTNLQDSDGKSAEMMVCKCGKCKKTRSLFKTDAKTASKRNDFKTEKRKGYQEKKHTPSASQSIYRAYKKITTLIREVFNKLISSTHLNQKKTKKS